jgi:hypothetical protein
MTSGALLNWSANWQADDKRIGGGEYVITPRTPHNARRKSPKSIRRWTSFIFQKKRKIT